MAELKSKLSSSSVKQPEITEAAVNELAKAKLKAYLKRNGTSDRLEKKRWLFTAWTYFSRYQKARKTLHYVLQQADTAKQGEKVMVNQKLEVYDGTFDVWTSIRKALVDWAFTIFQASNELAVNRMRYFFHYARTSYSAFRTQIEETLQAASATPIGLLMSTYSRLKNLVRDEIPQMDLGWKLQSKDDHTNHASFEPEHMQRVIKFDFETSERANQWVQDTLRFILDKKRLERNDPSKEVLYLFRLLSILFRLEHPTTGKRFEIKKPVLLTLESKICTSLMSLFDSSGATGVGRSTASRSKSKNRNTQLK
jgi:hypothetical protein